MGLVTGELIWEGQWLKMNQSAYSLIAPDVHVGGGNNSKKVFSEFDSPLLCNAPHFSIVLAPTWPSYHVSAIKKTNQSFS